MAQPNEEEQTNQDYFRIKKSSTPSDGSVLHALDQSLDIVCCVLARLFIYGDQW